MKNGITEEDAALLDEEYAIFEEEIKQVKQSGGEYYDMFIKPYVKENVEQDKEKFMTGYLAGWYRRTVV